MDDLSRLRWYENMVGWLFHKVQAGVEDIRDTWNRALKPQRLPKFRLPIGWWIAYALVAWGVWAVWPVSKELPTEVWLGVLSFEGVLAALLASVGPAVTNQAILPSTVSFWSELDPGVGHKLTEIIRNWHADPVQAPNLSPFKNAFVVTLNTLFLLPLVVVLDSRWTAAILAASLIWTARRILSDALAFILPEWVIWFPRAYWITREWHESLAYCPVCKDKPQSVAWPPPKRVNDPEEHGEEMPSHHVISQPPVG